MMRRAIVQGILWCVMAAACGDSGSPPGGGSDAGARPGELGDPATGSAGSASSGTALARISLDATSAQLRKRLGFARPTSHDIFVELGVALTNVQGTEPLPVTALSFEVGTADKLLYPGITTEGIIAMGCPSRVAVEAGGTLSCQIGFQIPEGAVATHLVYSDGEARSASAVIAAVAPALPVCAYWQTPASDSCLACTSTAAIFQCGGQAFQVENACSAETSLGCLTTDACPQFTGDCTPSAACGDALTALQDCLYDDCFTSCPQTGL